MDAMTRQARIDRALALDDLELEEEGGCGGVRPGGRRHVRGLRAVQLRLGTTTASARPATRSRRREPARSAGSPGPAWSPASAGPAGREPEAYELEHRTRSRFEPGDTGWYLFGGGDSGPGAVGEYLARTLIYAMEGAAGLVALR